MKIKNFKQKFIFKTTTYDFYESFVDAKKVIELTQSPATVSRAVKGPFSLKNGEILGTHIDLIHGQKINQAWRMKSWPENYYSETCIKIEDSGQWSHIFLKHTGIPKEDLKKVEQFWNELWNQMRTKWNW